MGEVALAESDLPDPSDLQWDAIKQVSNFLDNEDRQVFRLFGAAGTGKTTIIQHIIAENPQHGPFYPCALSGKAVDVMRNKGLPQATTIHSLLYSPVLPDPEQVEQLYYDLSRAKNKSKQAEIRRELQRLTQLRWGESQFFKKALAGEIEGTIILEEASMVGEAQVRDLMETGLKIIAVGDPFQLPPVQDKPFLTVDQPDVFLTQIHRQAEESGILRLATEIRNGRVPAQRKEKDCLVVNQPLMSKGPLLGKFDQVLCGKHATRLRLNAAVREVLGYQSAGPERGERLICIKNNTVASSDGRNHVSVFNGQNLRVMDTFENMPNAFDMTLSKLHGDEAFRQEVYEGPFLDHYDYDPDRYYRDHRIMNQLFQADFGYAITCHKAQGSEYPNVYIHDDGFGKNSDERRKWLYTAVTRAQQSVVLNTPLAS